MGVNNILTLSMRHMRGRQLWRTVIVLSLISSLGGGTPSSDQYSRGLDWLSRYGYLPPPDQSTGRLLTSEGIQKALKQMQRFAGLEETGTLDSSTLALMETPRCSLPDIIGTKDFLRNRKWRKRRSALTGFSWHKPDITWSVHSYPSPNTSPSLSPELVDLILTYALKTWGDLVPLNFHFLGPTPNLGQGAPNQEGDIRVLFTTSYHDDGYPFDGKGGTLAHAFFPGTADLSGDAHFDDGDSWSYGYTNDRGTTDLFTVAVHEFGHALGLSHSSAELSIMRPFYQGTVGDILNYTLSMDDRLAIQSLYGKRGMSASLPTSAPSKSITPHHSMPPPPREAPQPDPGLPNRCEGKYDAVANIRGELLFFKGPYFWRIQQGSLLSTRPILIHSFWVGLPEGTAQVDAVYERTDRHIVFFIGAQYWMFRDTFCLPGYPRPLEDWAMRTVAGRAPERVEAAFVWAHNGKTYLFSKGEFWRFDETGQDRKLEAGYPKMASLWSGVPSHPDDIISWGDGDAYFFKDVSFWVLKRGELDQGNITPKSVAVEWMHCEVPALRPTDSYRNPNHRGRECYCSRDKEEIVQTSKYLTVLSLSFVFIHFL